MDGEFRAVRPDGASGRARRQHPPGQAPRALFSGQTSRGGILLVTFLLLLTKFVGNKFEQALLGPQGGLQGCNP